MRTVAHLCRLTCAGALATVIQRPATETSGGLATPVVGSGPAAQGTLRYGGEAGPHGAYRTFAKYSRFADQKLANGFSGADGWSRMHGGFRADWNWGGAMGSRYRGIGSPTGAARRGYPEYGNSGWLISTMTSRKVFGRISWTF